MSRVVLLATVATISFLAGFALNTMLSEQNNGTIRMKNTDRQIDEELIRKVEATYDLAWQQRNVDGVLACLTEDALLINPRGEVAAGRGEIRNLLSKFLEGPAKGSKHTSYVTRINFVTNDVAVVDGEALIEGLKLADSSTLRHRFTDILVRSGDVWLIAHVRAYGK